MTTTTNNKSALQQAAKNIDVISKAAMEAFASAESFEKELAVATAVSDLRAALTADVMKEVMGLMNTSIGFDTDRNPVKWNSDKPFPGAYSVEVVRDVFIEARMRGFHIIGNEFNIIAGNFYARVNGLERKVKQHPKVANFKDHYDVPRLVANGEGALIKCRAEWHQEGVAQLLEREFAIRVNRGQGADAITGKAKRKLLAAVYSRLSGVVTPEGDADDVTDVTGARQAQTAPSAENLFGGTAAQAKQTNTNQAAEATTVPPVAPVPETKPRCKFYATEGDNAVTNNRCTLPEGHTGEHKWERPTATQTELKVTGGERKFRDRPVQPGRFNA